MNILLRKHLRHILHSKHSTANETLQLDAGWNKTHTEILIRKVKLYTTVMTAKQTTLANKIARLAAQNGTPWFEEIKQELGESRMNLLN